MASPEAYIRMFVSAFRSQAMPVERSTTIPKAAKVSLRYLQMPIGQHPKPQGAVLVHVHASYILQLLELVMQCARLHLDSAAARGSCRCLWLQALAAAKEVVVSPVSGTKTPADIGTNAQLRNDFYS